MFYGLEGKRIARAGCSWFWVWLFFNGSGALAGDVDTTLKVVQAASAAAAPALDGDLEEPAWSAATAISDFQQQEPQEGGQPSERTEVRILYTEDSMFVGIWCYDSAPGEIRATERQRDSQMDSDDAVWLVLDTAHSHRDSYFFRTNPLGNQWDALVTDEGKVQNEDWDGRWEAAAKVQPWGWGAELKIPFRSLRIPSSKDMVWGIDFKRFIRRKNEAVSWSNFRRDFEFDQVSHAGHLTGLAVESHSLNLQIKPYAAANLLRVDAENQTREENSLDAGLENLRYMLTSRLKLDATVNPDFAQANVDDLRINLTRFPLFFDEKREFFLEDSGLFELGATGRGQPDLTLLHTRRIGLTPQREPIPILYGLRLTGQLPDWSLGAMNVQTREEGQVEAGNFGAYRIKRSFLARSYIGAMATHAHRGNSENNAAFGIDANLRFLEKLQFQAFLAKTESTGPEGNGWAAVPFWLSWDSDLVSIQGRHMIIDRDFNPSLGFIARGDIQSSSIEADYKPRPRIRGVRQLMFSGDLSYVSSRRDVLQTRNQELSAELEMENGDSFEFEYTRNMERQDTPFDVAGRLAVRPGVYRNNIFSLQYAPYDGRRVSGFVSISREDFWGGKRTSLNLNPTLRWSDKFVPDVGYELERVVLPGGSFTSHILNSRLEVNPSNRWLTSTTLQYNHLDEEWGINFRLNYIYRPGDDVFFILTRSGIGPDRSLSVALKFTHTFDF